MAGAPARTPESEATALTLFRASRHREWHDGRVASKAIAEIRLLPTQARAPCGPDRRRKPLTQDRDEETCCGSGGAPWPLHIFSSVQARVRCDPSCAAS